MPRVTINSKQADPIQLFFFAVKEYKNQFKELPGRVVLSKSWEGTMQHTCGLMAEEQMIVIVYREDQDQDTALAETTGYTGYVTFPDNWKPPLFSFGDLVYVQQYPDRDQKPVPQRIIGLWYEPSGHFWQYRLLWPDGHETWEQEKYLSHEPYQQK